MIDVRITGKNYDPDGRVKKYVQNKIGKIDRYLGKPADGVQAQVVLEEDPSGRENNNYVCEIILHVPGEVFQAKEATYTMYAAIDICEAKIRAQVAKHKQKHSDKRHQRSLKKLFRRNQ